MSRSRTSRRCSSGMALDNGGAKLKRQLPAWVERHLYGYQSGQGCRVSFYVPKRRDPDSPSRPRASANTYCYSVSTSPAEYRRTKPPLLLPLILLELLVVSHFTGSEDIAFHTLISLVFLFVIIKFEKKVSLPLQ